MTKIHRSETGMPRSFAGRLEPIRPSTTLSDKRGTRRSGQRCVSESRQFTSIAKCPRIETSMPLGVWVDRTSIQGPLSLLVMGLVAVGCVNLDKPIAVQMCSATATCSNGAGKAAREDANNDLQHAETDLAGGRGGSGTDAGEVDVVLYPAPDLAAPDLVLDNTADQAVRVDGYKAPDATVIDDVVPASLPAQEPGPEQSGAEPGDHAQSPDPSQARNRVWSQARSHPWTVALPFPHLALAIALSSMARTLPKVRPDSRLVRAPSVLFAWPHATTSTAGDAATSTVERFL